MENTGKKKIKITCNSIVNTQMYFLTGYVSGYLLVSTNLGLYNIYNYIPAFKLLVDIELYNEHFPT